MLLSQEEWMDLRAFRAPRAAGATWAEIAREIGCDWRTVKKYLAAEAPAMPPAVARTRQGRLIDDWASVVDAWLTAEPRLQATVIHQRLAADHGFPGSYQRVKLYVAEARELSGIIWGSMTERMGAQGRDSSERAGDSNRRDPRRRYATLEKARS